MKTRRGGVRWTASTRSGGAAAHKQSAHNRHRRVTISSIASPPRVAGWLPTLGGGGAAAKMTRDAPVQHPLAASRGAAPAARPDPDVLLRADGLPADPRRQRAAVRGLDVASPLAARA